MRSILISVVVAGLALGAVGAEKKKEKGARTPKPSPKIEQRYLDLYEPCRFKTMPYRLMKPIDFDENKTYPLILSLHGAAGKGDDNLKNFKEWNFSMAEESWRKKYPCFVLMPQMRRGWTMVERDKSLKGQPGTAVLSIELIEQLKGEYKIDEERIYVLGHSMGGQGTWITIWNHPDYFAAAIPSAGAPFSPPDSELEEQPYSRFKDVPVWAFHSDDDGTIDVECSRKIFRAMQECGGNMKYTEVTGFGHGANKVAFTHPSQKEVGFETQYSSARCDKTEDVWDWLFMQKKPTASQ